VSSRLAALMFFINRHADCRAVTQVTETVSERRNAHRGNAAERKINRAICKVDGPDLLPKLSFSVLARDDHNAFR
jgi:hypothetical protein